MHLLCQLYHGHCHIVSSKLPLGFSIDLSLACTSQYILFFISQVVKVVCLIPNIKLDITALYARLLCPHTTFSISDHFNIYFHAIPTLEHSFGFFFSFSETN